MVVIRGRNVFPPDIETTIDSHFPEVEPGRVAVFGMPDQQTAETQRVVLIECRNLRFAPKLNDVYREIVNACQVPVMAIAILRRGSIARTTSGKIARHKCQTAYMQDQLEFLDIFQPAKVEEVEKTFEEYLDGLVCRAGLDVQKSITIAELGMDSLELVELSILLEKSFTQGKYSNGRHSRLIYDLRLLQAAKIGELRMLAKRLRSGLVSLEKIAHHLENGMQAIIHSEADQMRKDLSLSSSCIPQPYSNSTSKRTILLTAAGFLGSFLPEALLRLCHDPIVVLVRGQDYEHATLRVKTALAKTGVSSDRVSEAMQGRIHTLCGDVALANLGLSKIQWGSLAEEVTTVYHCAAEVDYIKTYQELRAANVAGTQEIIRLCCSGQAKELNFISTIFIFGWTQFGPKLESSCNARMEDLDFGYAQSKWVSEQLVYEAEKRGLRTRVFRPALLTASETGHYMRGDLTTRILAYMIRHHLSVDVEKQLSLLPVEICANNIVAIALLDDFDKTTFHLISREYYSVATVTSVMHELFGYEFSSTDIDGFVDHVNQHCTSDDDLFPLIAFFNNSRENFKSISDRLLGVCAVEISWLQTRSHP